ncbi:MAG: hypothetical protein ACXW61_18720, partial [Gemmatirosa sp.]
MDDDDGGRPMTAGSGTAGSDTAGSDTACNGSLVAAVIIPGVLASVHQHGDEQRPMVSPDAAAPEPLAVLDPAVSDPAVPDPAVSEASDFVFATLQYESGDWDSAPLVPANLIDT